MQDRTKMAGQRQGSERPYLSSVNSDTGAGSNEDQRRARHPRISALVARVDAGEREALQELNERLAEDFKELSGAGKRDLAVEAWAWFAARLEEVERADEYAAEEAKIDAPACWLDLRVRVYYVGPRGLSNPVTLAGRLEEVTDRGVRVAVDELEEDRDEGAPALASRIERRVSSQRFIGWSALLSLQPLPVRVQVADAFPYVSEGGAARTAESEEGR